MQSQMIIQGTRGVHPRGPVRDVPGAARARRRCPRPPSGSSTPTRSRCGRSWRCRAASWKFLRKEIQPYQGLRDLVADFYQAARRGDAAAGVDRGCGRGRRVDREGRPRRGGRPRGDGSRASSPQPTADFLVTGASGALGSAVVQRLLADGRSVRAFVRAHARDARRGRGLRHRRTSAIRTPWTARCAGAERVIHAGAAMSGRLARALRRAPWSARERRRGVPAARRASSSSTSARCRWSTGPARPAERPVDEDHAARAARRRSAAPTPGRSSRPSAS